MRKRTHVSQMLVHIPNQHVKPNRHRSRSKRLASKARRPVPEFLRLSNGYFKAEGD